MEKCRQKVWATSRSYKRLAFDEVHERQCSHNLKINLVGMDGPMGWR